MEDELDFDVDLEGAGAGGDDELALEDEDYEDLYDDVSPSFFPGNNAGTTFDEPKNSEDAKQNGKQKNSSDPDSVPAAAGAAAASSLLSPDAMPSVMISDLQWWTTDADLELALAEYGKLKGIKFLETRGTGRSKGFCQADFEDAYSGQLCKEKMNGRSFNGRRCVVQYATNQVVKQANLKAQTGQPERNQSQAPSQGGAGKRTGGRGNGSDGGGRGKPIGRGPGRGRGRGDQFGQMQMGMYDPSFGPPMRPGMYFMGGPGYGMPFPPGVAPHVNPAYFGGRGNGHWGNGGGGSYDDDEGNAEFEDGPPKTHESDYHRKSGKDEKNYKDREDSRSYKRSYDEDYHKRRRHGHG